MHSLGQLYLKCSQWRKQELILFWIIQYNQDLLLTVSKICTVKITDQVFFPWDKHLSQKKKKVLSLKSMDWENEAHKIFNNQGPIKGEDSN